MHEYSVVGALVQSVEAAMGGRDAVVRRVRVAIGEQSAVDCGLLQTAFEVFREGTVCAEAELVIDRIPARWECPSCTVVIPRGAFLRCPTCNEPARLAAGDEIVLQRVEMEVADVPGLRMR